MASHVIGRAETGEWGSTTVHGARPAPRNPDETAGARAHLAYAAGLDGVRALAVAAVVVFHISETGLTGGFLGVDIFFVLSGFLITSILLAEFHSRKRIDIKNFYLRRARRLLPALFTMLASVTLITWIFARDELHQLRGDVIAALTYCTNWTQIFWGRSYFDQLSRPSLLQHLWSLAVEEQFYLLWPLILIACLAATRRRWLVLAVPVGLAALSLVLMASMYHVGQDTSRIYYGTDTHIAPMLIGATVAIVVALRRQAGIARDTQRGRLVADAFALIGFLVLAWSVVEINRYSSGLYRGGYVFISLASAALIYAAGRQGTITAKALGWAPLVWIGQRSYAIYLWHWPILMLSRPGIDIHLPTWVVVPLQLAVIVGASDLSYRYIERPIRSRGFLAFVRGHRRHGLGERRPVTIGTVLVGVLAVVTATLATAPPAPAGIQVDRSATPTLHIKPPAARHHTRHAAGHHHRHRHAGASPTPSSSTAQAQPPFPAPVRVGFFGDSQGMTLLLNKPNGLGRYLTTSDDTVEGCGMTTGVIHSRTGYTRDLGADCGNWQSQWRTNAQRDHPQIAVIEIGAWDVFDETVGGKTLTFGTPAWDAYFTKTLHTGIRLLLNQGAQVALMGIPCYRPIAAGGLPLLPERGDDSRTSHLNELLQSALSMDPQRVFMIHPPSAFCKNPKIATDVNYRWDGTHYYKPGAALVFQVITPQLLAIPQPPPN